MLGDKEAMATIAVTKIGPAREFYEHTLGLKPLGVEDPSIINFRSGQSTVVVYESQYAGTNKATVATWPVGSELETIVKDLKTKGVVFEHYDLPGLTLEGDIHVADKFRVAWFKDPDGNTLSIFGS